MIAQSVKTAFPVRGGVFASLTPNPVRLLQKGRDLSRMDRRPMSTTDEDRERLSKRSGAP